MSVIQRGRHLPDDRRPTIPVMTPPVVSIAYSVPRIALSFLYSSFYLFFTWIVFSTFKISLLSWPPRWDSFSWFIWMMIAVCVYASLLTALNTIRTLFIVFQARRGPALLLNAKGLYLPAKNLFLPWSKIDSSRIISGHQNSWVRQILAIKVFDGVATTPFLQLIIIGLCDRLWPRRDEIYIPLHLCDERERVLALFRQHLMSRFYG